MFAAAWAASAWACAAASCADRVPTCAAASATACWAGGELAVARVGRLGGGHAGGDAEADEGDQRHPGQPGGPAPARNRSVRVPLAHGLSSFSECRTPFLTPTIPIDPYG